MITMARIQGSSMGYQNFQKPVIQMGQDSFSSGPVGTGVVPAASVPAVHQPAMDLQRVWPGVPPAYAYPVIETPSVPAPSPAIPTWAIVVGSIAAGAGLLYLLSNKN